MDDIDVWGSHEQESTRVRGQHVFMDGIQEAHEWCAWKKKKKKKPIGKRELVGLIRDLEKGLET